MRLLIIGAAGFIGTHLTAAAAAQNIEVIAISQAGGPIEGAKEAYAWSFGQPIPESACKDVSCVIYLAHDFHGEAGASRTVKCTLAIASQLQAAGIRRHLFFSSFSAGEHASSLYGRTKFEIEQGLAGQEGMGIIRPGLVLGEGGIYGRIRRWARWLPIVPLPDGGRGKVPVIEIKRLCDLTLKLALNAAPVAEANLFERESKSLRDLVLDAAAEVGHRPWILPIPAPLLIGTLTLAARLHLPLPVNADNLDGFMANQSAQHVSTLEKGGHS